MGEQGRGWAAGGSGEVAPLEVGAGFQAEVASRSRGAGVESPGKKQ